MKDFLKFTLASIVGIIIVGILFMVITIGAISALVSVSDQPVQVKPNSILVFKFENEIVERANKNPFDKLELPMMDVSKKAGLDDILACIRKAKTDDNIKGIYLNVSEIQSGLGTVEEIRNTLLDFKKSEKFIYAYGEFLSQKAYYLVSVADSIILNPIGIIDFRGLGGERNFYKKGLEKLGVEMQIVRHGKFKAAVEPYMLEKMSKENKEQVQGYLGSIWDVMLSDISESRAISVDELNAIADEVTTLRKPEYAMAKGMIDNLKYKDQVLDDLKELSGIALDKDLNAMNLNQYSKVPEKRTVPGLARDKIAVVYASGEIGMNDSNEGINSEELSKAIRKARRDSTIKAIVLRVNSPGGTAYGSEIIWREVMLASKEKPVVASMGDVAASGGYYIACFADSVIADRTTITGSIGIFGMIPNAQELLNDKLGITQDVVTTNKHSSLIPITRRMNSFERNLVQNFVDEGYDIFISHVADGRGMSKTEVDAIGEGRVWAAPDALELGLVDAYGGLNDAIEMAKSMAGLDNYRIVNLPKLKDPFEELIKELSGAAKAKILNEELGGSYLYYKQLKDIVSQNGIMARMPYDMTIE